MNILYISPAYREGAGQIAELERQMRKRGHQTSRLYAPHLPVRTLKSPSFALCSVVATLRSKKHDIIHAFNMPSAFAMRCSSGKRVLTSDAVWSWYVRESHSRPVVALASATERLVTRWADALTTDSNFTKESYDKMLGREFKLLRHPMDPDKFKEFSNIEEVLGRVFFLGRDSPEKGRDVLEAAEKNINGNIVYRTDVPWRESMSLLKSSSVLAVPSRIESLPRIIIEAFFLGVPVVATAVGGVPELIENGKTGTLVPPDNPAALAEGINQVLSDRQGALAMARRAREFALDRFSSEKIMPGYVDFYEGLLAR